MTGLPDADHVVLSSRVALRRDGGFAVAVPTRLRLLREAGAVDPLMLSLEGSSPETHAEELRELADAGLLDRLDRARNLFDDITADPSWLFGAGEPWPGPLPGGERRVVTDAGGRPAVSLPVLRDDPLWYLSDAPVIVHAPSGHRVLHGFRELYIAWLDSIAAGRRAASGDPDRLFVVIVESRQTGLVLAHWDDPRVRLVHTVHNSHLPAPYDDVSAAVSGLWERWLAVADRFDAVLWPTASQRDDIAARFGDPGTFHVVPNTIEIGAAPAVARDPLTVVMLNRLAPQKRVDLAIEAWARVVAEVPGARLDIYGDGPSRGELQERIDALGLSGAVRLHGRTCDRDAVFDRAALFLSSSAFEGQGLSIAEALSRGLPVVSFDVKYGPREAIGDAGVLVPPGDVVGLADAVVGLLGDAERRAALSARARVAASEFSADAVRPALVRALRAAASHPSRRAR